MRAYCNRDLLLKAFGMVTGVIPVRSPKAVLKNIKLIANDHDNPVLLGTDLEVGIRYEVLGVKVDEPGEVILPTTQMNSILRTCTDLELLIKTDENHLTVEGLHANFTLPLEDTNLFPDVPDFAISSYYSVVLQI